MPSNVPLPAPGEWPCQQNSDQIIGVEDPRLVTFLYLLLRDGATSPGDVEQLAIHAAHDDALPVFTNPHLERYARSLTNYLLDK